MSAHDFNTIDGCTIVEDVLRPGVRMKGVFNTSDDNIQKGTFLCAWTGIACFDTEENQNKIYKTLVNAFDVSRYGIGFGSGRNKVFVCPPLDEDGKPFCKNIPKGSNCYATTRGDPRHSMAVFLNEPDANHACMVEKRGHGYISTISQNAGPANVCLLQKVVHGHWLCLLYASSEILVGQELTLLYSGGVEYNRQSWNFSPDMRKLTIGDAYTVFPSRQPCNGVQGHHPPMSALQPLSIIDRLTFFPGKKIWASSQRTKHMHEKSAMPRRIVPVEYREDRASEEREKTKATYEELATQIVPGHKRTQRVWSFVRDVILDPTEGNPFKIREVHELSEPIALYKMLNSIIHRVKEMDVNKLRTKYIVRANEDAQRSKDSLESWETYNNPNTRKTYTIITDLLKAVDRLQETIIVLKEVFGPGGNFDEKQALLESKWDALKKYVHYSNIDPGPRTLMRLQPARDRHGLHFLSDVADGGVSALDKLAEVAETRSKHEQDTAAAAALLHMARKAALKRKTEAMDYMSDVHAYRTLSPDLKQMVRSRYLDAEKRRKLSRDEIGNAFATVRDTGASLASKSLRIRDDAVAEREVSLVWTRALLGGVESIRVQLDIFKQGELSFLKVTPYVSNIPGYNLDLLFTFATEDMSQFTSVTLSFEHAPQTPTAPKTVVFTGTKCQVTGGVITSQNAQYMLSKIRNIPLVGHASWTASDSLVAINDDEDILKTIHDEDDA